MGKYIGKFVGEFGPSAVLGKKIENTLLYPLSISNIINFFLDNCYQNLSSTQKNFQKNKPTRVATPLGISLKGILKKIQSIKKHN